MWKVILDLYQGSSETWKLALKEKLRNISISKGEPIIMYLSKVIQVQDELVGVGATVPNSDIMSLALLGLHKVLEELLGCSQWQKESS